MSTQPTRGTKQFIDGRMRVFYDGYWIRTYEVPQDTLAGKKRLIEALTRRLFNHVEHGLNVPGYRLAEARNAFETETCPKRKRVKAGMLAGALFNRATDVFTKLVELQSLGIEVKADNPLMRECGEHLQEALQLGKLVLHRSGEEGIDELWGEPFKVFAYPMEDFYKSRYIKIAMTMAAIDDITRIIVEHFSDLRIFQGLDDLARDYATAARTKCETLRTDPDIFDIWTSFAVAGERLCEFHPHLFAVVGPTEQYWALEGMKLIRESKQIIDDITRARVPMPKTTRQFIERCQQFRELSRSVLSPTQGAA